MQCQTFIIQNVLLTKASRPISQCKVPKMSQFYDVKYHIEKKKLPTRMLSALCLYKKITHCILVEDVVHNLNALYSGKFLHCAQTYPICFIFMSDFGANILKNCNTAITDGTFDIRTDKTY
jgi:hypothetical protein